jgi:hypothetical protein
MPKHTRSPEFTPEDQPSAEPLDPLDVAVANAIATVQADVAFKAATAAKGNLTTDPAASPKKKAAKALKEAKATDAASEVILKAVEATDAALPPIAEVTPHLDPESGLWIPKNPNHGKPKEPKTPKAPKPPKEPKAPKALKEVAGQPSRGPNSTTAVVSMKVPLKTALAKAATSNMRSLSAQAALYILEGLKRDGIIAADTPVAVGAE